MNNKRIKAAAAVLRKARFEKVGAQSIPGWHKLSSHEKQALIGLAGGLMRGALAAGKGLASGVGKMFGGPSAAAIARNAAPGGIGAAMSAARAAPMAAVRQGFSNAGKAISQGFQKDVGAVRSGAQMLGQAAGNVAQTAKAMPENFRRGMSFMPGSGGNLPTGGAVGNAAHMAGRAFGTTGRAAVRAGQNIAAAPGQAARWGLNNTGAAAGGAGLLGAATGLGIAGANGDLGSFNFGPSGSMAGQPQTSPGASLNSSEMPDMGTPSVAEPQLAQASTPMTAGNMPMPGIEAPGNQFEQQQSAMPDTSGMTEQVPQPAQQPTQQQPVFQRQPVIGSGAPVQTMMGNIRNRRAAGMGFGQGNGPIRRAFGR